MNGAFVTASAALILVFAAAGSPIPVMGEFRDEGVSNAQLAYASAAYFVLAAGGLLVLGRLSTHIGRRRASLIAVVAAVAGVLLMVLVDGAISLVVARALQGLACGVAPGALGAYVVDTSGARRWLSAMITGSAPMIGLPVGALLSGLAVEIDDRGADVIFVAGAVALSLAAVALTRAPETVERRPGAIASLVPKIRVPHGIRRSTAAAAFVFVATWPLGGFYQAFGSVVALDVLGSSSALAAGAMFASIMILNPLGGVLAARTPARAGVAVGMLGYGAALLCAAIGLVLGSALAFVIASLVGGVLQGVASTSAMRLLLPRTTVSDRADVLTAIYVTAYGSVALSGIAAAILAPQMPLESVALVYVAVGASAAVVAAFLPPRQNVPRERAMQ